MRLWTKQARKASRFEDSTPFSARCSMYLLIREVLKTEPSEIMLSLDAMRGSETLKAYKKAQNDAQRKGDLFSWAVECSKAFV
eukprot:6706875-Prymnesium_polylepis.1